MFTGVDKEKAIRAWQKGEDVRVLNRSIKDRAGNIPLMSMESFLSGYEFLVDVPAVVDPEFEEAFPAKELRQENALPEQQEGGGESEEKSSPPLKSRN